MDTVSCLLRYPWRTLAALGDVYHVSAHHHRDKKDVAQELSAAIHAQLVRTLAGLCPDALAALRALMQAENLAMPRSDFITRFGRVYPYRPWDSNAPPAPWPAPSSPAATLVHYGLVYPLNQGSTERPFNVILLPRDLGTAAIHLNVPIVPSISFVPARKPGDPSSVLRIGLQTLELDTFTFLSFLNRQDCSVRHGRWLPPRALKALNEHLRPSDDLGAGRSERQAARIPFLHYLAERAGLVGLIGGYLKPTLVADEWLAAPRHRRLRDLWDGWCERSDDNRFLWRRYCLPALAEDDDPLARFHTLLQALAACPAGPLGHSSNLLDALVEREPALLRPQATYAAWAALDPDERADFESRARAVLRRLLDKHLTWFGVLELRILRPGSVQVANGEWANADRSGRGEYFDQAQYRWRVANSERGELAGSAVLCLTPLGAALLGRDDGDWPDDPDPAPLHVAPLLDEDEPSVLIQASPGLSLAHRFFLEGIVPPEPVHPGQYALDRDADGSSAESERGGDVLGQDAGGSSAESERGGNVLGQGAGGSSAESERGGDVLGQDADGSSAESERGGNVPGRDADGSSAESERGGNVLGQDAGGSPVGSERGGYTLTQSHFAHALQRGHTGAGVAGFLERASGEPLSAPVMGALYRWEDDLNRVTIRQTLLLQTRDPALLRDLSGQRRVRETLGKTLNERTVEVRADRLDALVRRLAWRDVIPRLDLDADLSRSAAGRAKTTESEDERAALAIALRVYAHLADELGLSARPASALAHRWSKGLPLRLRDAVERQVERILDALHRASPLEMEDRLPEPTGPLLEVLERAIQERGTIEIEYYTAGRGHHTTRRVDPLRLEWRGDVVYLVAYCHLREDERVFRVDRMERILRPGSVQVANCE